MMQVFRRAAAGWVAKIFVGLLALSFGVWGINDVFRGYQSEALASVGSYEVSAETFRQAFQQRLRNLSRQSGQPITAERARELGLDRQYLGELLRNGTLQEQARHLKLQVPDTVVAQAIADEPAFHNSQGQFDAERFRRILMENGLSEQMFLAEEKSGRLREALVRAIAGDIIVPNALVEAIVQQANEQRDAKYFVVMGNEADIATPGDAELKEFHQKNTRLFTAPAYRSLVVLKVEPKDFTGNMTVTDDEVAAAYEVRKDEYRTPERRTIDQIPFPSVAEANVAKQRIAQGADFLAVARERGFQDKDVELGNLAKSEILDKAIADAAFSLTAGTVSDPVQGKLSTVLLRVRTIAPETTRSLAEVRDDIANKVKLDRARDEVLSTHDKVEDERATGASFEDIAKNLRIPLITVPAVDAQGLDKNGKPVDLPAKDDVLRMAFESEVAVENDSITTADDGSVWVDVREVEPSVVRPFDTVRAEVESAWKAQKMRQNVMAKAAELVKRAEGGATLDTLAREAGAEVKTMLGVKRNETAGGFDAGAVAALFSVPDNGFAFAAEPDGKGAKIMQALPVMTPPFDPKSKEAETARQALRQGLTNDVLALYIADLQNRFGTTINNNLWQQVTGSGL
jgi:peptidyl-prolyl cis-trans isomerase D